MKATLVLEDGTVMEGEGFGASGEVVGEVCFCTSMTGYQEALTDPSYAGQILILTYPLVGNYGVDPERHESDRIQVEGFVVREVAEHPDHPRSAMNLDRFLEQEGIPGISGVDTRALTRTIREQGVMKGTIRTGEAPADPGILLEKTQAAPAIGDQDLIERVTRREVEHADGPGPRIAVLDLGMKDSIRQNLLRRDCALNLLPAGTPPEQIRGLNPDGLVISPGPGDPERARNIRRTVKDLMDEMPTFGICLGHQILALACGADTYKLKYGHRGANQPVKDTRDGKVYMTSQNHGYAVDDDTIPVDRFEIDKRNVNDGTVEGMRHRELPVMSVQYHPEAHPGPHDSDYLFDEFLELVRND